MAELSDNPCSSEDDECSDPLEISVFINNSFYIANESCSSEMFYVSNKHISNVCFV